MRSIGFRPGWPACTIDGRWQRERRSRSVGLYPRKRYFRMTDEVQTLVLELLRAIRADIGDMRREQRDMKARLVSVENQLVQMHKGLALIHEDMAGLNVRLDGLGERVERIERRLELRESA
jgi:hypothetical protein